MGREFVLRGAFDNSIGVTTTSLVVDDGLHNKGYRVKEFYILPNLFQGQTTFAGIAAMLSTNLESSTWNLEHDDQVAWFTAEQISYAHWEEPNGLCDDTVIFNRDLYVHAWNANAASSALHHWSYFVRLEEVELTDNQAVLILANEVNQ